MINNVEAKNKENAEVNHKNIANGIEYQVISSLRDRNVTIISEKGKKCLQIMQLLNNATLKTGTKYTVIPLNHWAVTQNSVSFVAK